MDAYQQALQTCRQLVWQNHENFPLASWFLPRTIREVIIVIYAFARYADDIADDPDKSRAIKYRQLQLLQNALQKIQEGRFVVDNAHITDPILADILYALTMVHRTGDSRQWAVGSGQTEISKSGHPQKSLPKSEEKCLNSVNFDIHLLQDLLMAFKLDIEPREYVDESALLAYCQYSANPVGRLLLQLHQVDTYKARDLSDQICTALQLINMIQDIREDWIMRQRLYIPLADFRRAGVKKSKFTQGLEQQANCLTSQEEQLLLRLQIQRAQKFLQGGSQLPIYLQTHFPHSRCLQWELRIMLAFAGRLLNKMSQRKNLQQAIKHPITLSIGDKIMALYHSCVPPKSGQE